MERERDRDPGETQRDRQGRKERDIAWQGKKGETGIQSTREEVKANRETGEEIK